MDESTKDKTTIWIKNEHGVVSAKEAWLGKKMVARNYGWAFASEEEINKELGVEVEGQEEDEDEIVIDEDLEDLGIKELRVIAKNKGVNSFGKSKEQLIRLLEL